jgi:hypothetical protein
MIHTIQSMMFLKQFYNILKSQINTEMVGWIWRARIEFIEGYCARTANLAGEVYEKPQM